MVEKNSSIREANIMSLLFWKKKYFKGGFERYE